MTFIRAVVSLIGFYVDFSNFLVGISFSLRLVLWSLFHPKRASSVDGSRSEEGPRFLFSVSLWRHHVHCIHGDLAPFGALHVVVSVRVSQSCLRTKQTLEAGTETVLQFVRDVEDRPATKQEGDERFARVNEAVHF